MNPAPLSGFPFKSRLGAATLNDPNQDHHYCDYPKDMDKSAHRSTTQIRPRWWRLPPHHNWHWKNGLAETNL